MNKINVNVLSCKAVENTTKAGVKFTSYILRVGAGLRTIMVDGIATKKNVSFFMNSASPIALQTALSLTPSNYNLVSREAKPSAEYPQGGRFNWLQLKAEVAAAAPTHVEVVATTKAEA